MAVFNFFMKQDMRSKLDQLVRRDAAWSGRLANTWFPESPDDLRDPDRFVAWMDSRAEHASALALDLTGYRDFAYLTRGMRGSDFTSDSMALRQSYFLRAGKVLYGVDPVAYSGRMEGVDELARLISSGGFDAVIDKLDRFSSDWKSARSCAPELRAYCERELRAFGSVISPGQHGARDCRDLYSAAEQLSYDGTGLSPEP